MSRRIELPDEFAFGDGTRVGRPADLAARIEAELYRESELWQRLEDGDFLRWLQQGGWESLIQRLEQFRQHSGGKDVLEFLEILRQDSGIRGPNQATSTEGRGPTFPAGSSLRSPESQPVRKRALAARPSAGEVQPNRTKYYARSALLMRQVEAPRPFGRAHTAQRQAEPKEDQRLRSSEASIRPRAAAAPGEAESQYRRAQETTATARRMFSGVGTDYPRPGIGEGPSHKHAAIMLRRPVNYAADRLPDLAEAVRILEAWRRKETKLFRLAPYAYCTALVMLALLFIFRYMIEMPEPQPQLIYKAPGNSPEMKQARTALPGDATPVVSSAPKVPGTSERLRATPSVGVPKRGFNTPQSKKPSRSSRPKSNVETLMALYKDAEQALKVAPGDGRARPLMDRIRRIRSIVR